MGGEQTRERFGERRERERDSEREREIRRERERERDSERERERERERQLVPPSFGLSVVCDVRLMLMSMDVFSLCSDDDCLISLLLHLGPRPVWIGRLFLASKFVRSRLCDDSFARKFLSLYLSVCILDVPRLSWWKELKSWFLRRETVYAVELEVQGNEMRQLQCQADNPVVSVSRKENGVLLVEHVMKMVQRSESLSDSLPNASLDLQMIVLQPRARSFPLLPLSRSHCMYYEVRLAKHLPKLGSPIIGFALPSLKTTFPGRSTCSVGVALDRLTAYVGFSEIPEQIPSPRGNAFKPKKGDVFGVGLIYALSDAPPPFQTHLPESQDTHELSADVATFYVTFNGQLIYHKPYISCYYQLVPTIVLSTFGDTLQVNFGAERCPANFFSQCGSNATKAMSANVIPMPNDSELLLPLLHPTRFYTSTWKFDPYEAHRFLPAEVYSYEIASNRAESSSSSAAPTPLSPTVSALLSLPKCDRNFYWQGLEDQEKVVPVALDEMMWRDPSFHLFGVHLQNTLDYMDSRIKSHGYVPLIDVHSVAKCMEAANLQHLVSNGLLNAERARTLMLSALANEQEVQTLLNHPDPLSVFLQWTESLVRYWERKLAWDLVLFLKTDLEGRYGVDHVPILFSWIALDKMMWPNATAASPIYECLETISERWYATAGLETCIVRMLKAVCQMFWTSRINHLHPSHAKTVRQAPNVAYLGIHWTAHLFQSLGFLPFDGATIPANAAQHGMSKEDIRAIYDKLTAEQLTDLHQAVVCAFSGSHCAHHSPTAMSNQGPWLPADPIDAIKATLDAIIQQRTKFLTTPEYAEKRIWRKDIFELLGGAITSAYKLHYPTSDVVFPTDADFTGVFWHFSRYSDRFHELTASLRGNNGDAKRAMQQQSMRNQIQWYWNEKCAFIGFWYGEAFLKNVVADLFSNFPVRLATTYKQQTVYSDNNTAPTIDSTATRVMATGLITVGLLAAGLALAAAFSSRRVRRLLSFGK